MSESYGDLLAQQIARRLGPPVADLATLTAIAPTSRADGMLFLKLDDSSLWVFDADSAATASDDCKAPDEGTGRFLLYAMAGQGRMQKRTLTVTHADLTAAALTQSLNLGAALPANARIVGRELRLATAFSGGGAAAVSVDVGGTDDDAIVDGANLFTGAPAAQAGTSGINPTGLLGSQQLTAKFISNVNVADLTAGEVTIDVFFVALP